VRSVTKGIARGREIQLGSKINVGNWEEGRIKRKKKNDKYGRGRHEGR